MPEKILIQPLHDGQVVRVTLNAPKGNILDGAMMGELREALEALSRQPQAKLLVLAGQGDHFSFGASVPEHTREHAAGMLHAFHGLFHALMDLAVPTAAVVSGRCLGGGLELALMCQFLFADRSARLAQPEINLGVFAPPASLILPLKVGQARADDLLLTGRTMTAEEAAAMGLVTQVFDDRASLEAGVEAWVRRHVLSKSAASLRHAVRAARWTFHATLRAQLKQLERLYIDRLMATHDANEGIEAFLEKRAPRWENG